MKKFIKTFLFILAVFSAGFFFGCGDTIINNYNTTTENARLEPGYLYVATQTAGYVDGAYFYLDSTGRVRTDLLPDPNVFSYSYSDPNNHDFIEFRISQYGGSGDTLRFRARKTPWTISSLPLPGNSSYPFRGAGIIDKFNLFMVYDQEHSIMHLFNILNGATTTISAVYTNNKIVLSDGRELRPNSVTPDPLSTNVHEWHDPAYYNQNEQIVVYRIFWGLPGEFKNPGKRILK